MSSRYFLEKIIQKPINLPAVNQSLIDTFFLHELDKQLKKIKISESVLESFSQEFNSVYNSHIKKLFKTLRIVKRYLNSLKSSLPPIKDEIYLFDFLVLEVIKVNYPSIYSDIWRNKWFYIPRNWTDEGFTESPFSITDKDKNISLIKNHIDQLIEWEPQNEIIKELLMAIFPVEIENVYGKNEGRGNLENDYRANKRLTHPACFNRYFTLSTEFEEISDRLVEDKINRWSDLENPQQDIDLNFESFREKGELKEFLDRLKIFSEKINLNTAYGLIKVIYKNAHKFSNEEREWGNSEYDYSLSLLLKLINDKFHEDHISEILREIILDTPSTHFAVHVTLACSPERSSSLYNIQKNIEIGILRELTSDHLEQIYINEKTDIFDDLSKRELAFVIHQWATFWMTFGKYKNKEINNYLLSLVEVDKDKLIKLLWCMSGGRGENAFNYEELNKIYDLKPFIKIAKGFLMAPYLSGDDKKLIDGFLSAVDLN